MAQQSSNLEFGRAAAGSSPQQAAWEASSSSANSAAMALAMFVSGHETPNQNLRAFWGIALGAVAAVLAGVGSLTAIQTASIATAFPLMFLLLVMYGTFRGLNQYRAEQGVDE